MCGVRGNANTPVARGSGRCVSRRRLVAHPAHSTPGRLCSLLLRLPSDLTDRAKDTVQRLRCALQSFASKQKEWQFHTSVQRQSALGGCGSQVLPGHTV